MEGLRNHVSTHRLQLVNALPSRGSELGLHRRRPLVKAERRLAGKTDQGRPGRLRLLVEEMCSPTSNEAPRGSSCSGDFCAAVVFRVV